jgi:Tol biopolymer transport system component
MKFIASVLLIIALGVGLLGCPSSGGGGGGGSSSAFAVSTTSADFGVVGNVGYSSTLSATGGTPPYMWTDVGNELPALGLTLIPTTGVIFGNPTVTTATDFAVTFLVTDSAGGTASGPVTLRLRPRTDRASVNTAGNSVTGSSNTAPSISRTSGRFIAFSSTASLVTGVTGNQVYVHDRNTGQPSLVSKSSLGIAGIGGLSNAASISADGRFITFVSTATNLVPGVNGQQIYLHDTQPLPNGVTTLVSKDGSGNPASAGSSNTSPTISADGRFVAFVSNATNLVGNFGQQIYLHDTQPLPNGVTTLVSKDGSGNPASAGSSNASPTINADGRFVAFASNATNLVATVTGQQVYRHDTQTGANGQNAVVSLDSSDLPGTGGNSIAPSITANGSFVAFSSSAPLIPPAAATDVYVRATP